MLHAASVGAQTVSILSDDTDVEKWNRTVININATQLGEKCSGILGMHALSGCDTVSYPSGKGKVSALKVLTHTDIPGLDSGSLGVWKRHLLLKVI